MLTPFPWQFLIPLTCVHISTQISEETPLQFSRHLSLWHALLSSSVSEIVAASTSPNSHLCLPNFKNCISLKVYQYFLMSVRVCSGRKLSYFEVNFIFFFSIYLFGCTMSWLSYTRSSVFVAAWRSSVAACGI